jgi:hypothetical protein
VFCHGVVLQSLAQCVVVAYYGSTVVLVPHQSCHVGQVLAIQCIAAVPVKCALSESRCGCCVLSVMPACSDCVYKMQVALLAPKQTCIWALKFCIMHPATAKPTTLLSVGKGHAFAVVLQRCWHDTTPRLLCGRLPRHSDELTRHSWQSNRPSNNNGRGRAAPNPGRSQQLDSGKLCAWRWRLTVHSSALWLLSSAQRLCCNGQQSNRSTQRLHSGAQRRSSSAPRLNSGGQLLHSGAQLQQDRKAVHWCGWSWSYATTAGAMLQGSSCKGHSCLCAVSCSVSRHSFVLWLMSAATADVAFQGPACAEWSLCADGM